MHILSNSSGDSPSFPHLSGELNRACSQGWEDIVRYLLELVAVEHWHDKFPALNHWHGESRG